MSHPYHTEIAKRRHPTSKIHPLILNRWSPRAMTGETITDSEIEALFEAARWAPSSYNNQPWRFLYGKKDTPAWPLFFDLMIEFNQKWAQNAAILVLALSKTIFDKGGKFCRTHSFDTGAAWMALALEGSSRGLVVHAMEGFDYDRARQSLNIPEDHHIEALIAIGRHAPIETLSQDLQKLEIPSSRKEVIEFIREGVF